MVMLTATSVSPVIGPVVISTVFAPLVSVDSEPKVKLTVVV